MRLFLAGVGILLLAQTPFDPSRLSGKVEIGPQPPAPNPTSYVQPRDNDVREVIGQIIEVHDGDTFTCDVISSQWGEAMDVKHKLRVRLSGVHCFEMNDPNPANLATAKTERDALAAALFGAKLVTLKFNHVQSHDRYVASVYTESMDVCAYMLTFPQGGK
jgi:endonuclease YncB( thermonuclease family)